jgi:hypothetical protein
MTQTLYAHMNKRNNKKRTHIEISINMMEAGNKSGDKKIIR